MFPINRSPTAYAYLFKTGERVFDSRERQPHGHTTPTAYSDVSKIGEPLFGGRETQRIINDIETNRSWNGTAGDIVPEAVTQLPTWPADKHLDLNVVSNDGVHRHEFGKQLTTTPLRMQLRNNHYEAIIAGQVTPVASDGNCFYHSLLLTLNHSEQQQLLGTAFISYDRNSIADDANNPNVMALRQLLASYLRENPAFHNFFPDGVLEHENSILQDEQAKGPIAEAAALARELQVAEDAALARELQVAEDAALARELQVAEAAALARELQVAEAAALARELQVAEDAVLARRLEQQAVVKVLLAGV